LIARLALAAVFFVAGLAKLLDLAGSRAAITSFGLPNMLAAPIGVALPVIELMVAIALIPASSASWGALGALILLALFVVGIASVMIRGREAECHCFGQLHSSRVGWTTLGRNIILAMVAGFVVVGQRRGVTPSYTESISGLTSPELLVLFAGAIGLVVVAAGGWFMMNLLRQHGRMLLRLDTLEAQLVAQGIIANPSGAGSADGLLPGALAPSFTLDDLNGASTTLDDLLGVGPPLMLVFSHPGCTPCITMLPEVAGWQREHRANLTIAFISQGSAEDNRVAAELGIERVLLQRDREVAEAYEAWGTPSAVLVSREGTIASPIAQGAAAIRVLISSAARTALSDVNLSLNENGNGNAARLQWSDGNTASMSGVGLDAS
jgi:uncharacterized membrane protein YphA (DoxX/SURF4 family)/peroxiredoxin